MPRLTFEEEIAEYHVYLAPRNRFLRLGVKGFEDACARGFEPVSIIVSSDPELRPFAERAQERFSHLKVWVEDEGLTDELIRGHYGRNRPVRPERTGVRAVFSMPELPDARDVVERCRRVVVLDNVNTPVNHVSIARLAPCFGVDAILLAGETRFTYSNRLYRQTRGAIHDMTVARLRSWPDDIDGTLKRNGFTTVALALRDDAVEAQDLRLDPAGRTAVVLGNENRGLDEAVIDRCDVTAIIPMSRGVDSLNVSNACAIMLHELGRKA